MWYTDPAWYALAISISSVIIGISALRNGQRVAKLTIEQRLAQRQLNINEGIVKYQIRGPFAHHLNIPNKHLTEFSAKANILLYHLSLLEDVFTNKDVLGKRTLDAYSHWASAIVRPWIEADEDLMKSWQLVKDNKDFYDEEFLRWLHLLIPIVDRPVSKSIHSSKAKSA